MKLYLKDYFLDLSEPVIMGILNLTPDSFSDGGKYYHNGAALAQVKKMVDQGADIIDVGGESTRPGAQRVSIEEEIDRVLPVIEKIKSEFDIPVSIDTYKERVARTAVLEGGADIINDISALSFSENMAVTVADLDVPVVIMHIKGTPENMQNDPYYADVIAEIKEYLHHRIDFALAKGIKKEKIVIDPGIGFGKRVEDNIAIISRLREFLEFELPILIGVSNKSFLGMLSGEEIAAKRVIETVTANLIALKNGASIIRVHDVKSALTTIKVWKELTEKS